MVIAIDGPAGSWKRIIARELAKKTGFKYVDSGAMYRAVALKAIRDNIDMTDEDGLSRMFRDMDLTQKYENEMFKIYCDGEDITEEIQKPEVGKVVSIAAEQSAIRYHVTALLHVWGSGGNIIMEGSDIGTYVFPDADYKFFIDASPRIRAERKYAELKNTGFTGTVDEIEKEIMKRDELDKTRELAPLKIARDAIIIDTSSMTIEQVVDMISRKIGK